MCAAGEVWDLCLELEGGTSRKPLSRFEINKSFKTPRNRKFPPGSLDIDCTFLKGVTHVGFALICVSNYDRKSPTEYWERCNFVIKTGALQRLWWRLGSPQFFLPISSAYYEKCAGKATGRLWALKSHQHSQVLIWASSVTLRVDLRDHSIHRSQ